MYLGSWLNSSVTKQYFQYIAKLIDDEPALSHERRKSVYYVPKQNNAARVLFNSLVKLWARVLIVKSPTFSQLIADLPVFIRQSHAALIMSLLLSSVYRRKNLWNFEASIEDRMISGEGTPEFMWLEAFKKNPLDRLNLKLFQSKRVVIVAPHPDDEVLGCGGLMQQLVEQNCHIVILAVSNGTQSHPHSVKYTLTN